MAKSPDAFRTISEVADWLGVQAHVLRFWESKFAQVKPIKRAGGRRYYRPADMLLLGGLKKVLHEDGLTIKGAQKLLREKGVSYVADLSQPLDDLTIAVIEGTSAPVETEVETAPEHSSTDVTQDGLDDIVETLDATTPEDPPVAEPAEPEMASSAMDEGSTTEMDPLPTDDTLPVVEDETQPDLPLDTADDVETEPAPTITFRSRHRDVAPPPIEDAEPSVSEQAELAEDATASAVSDITSDVPADDAPTLDEPPLKPRQVEVTLVHDHTQIEVSPSALSTLSRIKSLSPEHAQDIRPLLARLTRLRASMANPRNDLRKD